MVAGLMYTTTWHDFVSLVNLEAFTHWLPPKLVSKYSLQLCV